MILSVQSVSKVENQRIFVQLYVLVLMEFDIIISKTIGSLSWIATLHAAVV